MEKEIGLIWMSAGNSYFSEENIGKLLRFADKEFKRILIVSPSKPAEHTFRALGYDEKEAVRKAKLNSNLLKNRALRELSKVNHRNKFQIVDWEKEVVESEAYKESLDEMQRLYDENPEFREDARETTRKVIADKSEGLENVERAIDEAVLYLLEELAFILSCPKRYSMDKVAYIYHKEWEIYEDLITGKYDVHNRKQFRFVLARI
jgi:tRNA-dependent cyclodipeptide synthase